MDKGPIKTTIRDQSLNSSSMLTVGSFSYFTAVLPPLRANARQEYAANAANRIVVTVATDDTIAKATCVDE